LWYHTKADQGQHQQGQKHLKFLSLAKIRLIGSTGIGQSNSSNSVSVFYGHRLDRLGRVPPQLLWSWSLYNGASRGIDLAVGRRT